MYEHGAVWTLVGADGTTVVLNDGSSGLYLEDVTGWDSPSVRTNVEDLPEADGAIAGASYFGQRPWTLSGKVGVNLAASTRNAAVASFQRAARGLRTDLTVKSQPSGMPAMQATARLVSLRVTGGFVKDFLAAFVSADPRAYSQTLNSQTGTWQAEVGGTWPWHYPVDWHDGNRYGITTVVTNAGNFDTPPTIRITGPFQNPVVRNETTGKQLDLTKDGGVTTTSSGYVDIDMAARTVTRFDGTNLYSKVTIASDWWQLAPGANTIRLGGYLVSKAASLRVQWRDAWA